jgi:hypothetical protein
MGLWRHPGSDPGLLSFIEPLKAMPHIPLRPARTRDEFSWRNGARLFRAREAASPPTKDREIAQNPSKKRPFRGAFSLPFGPCFGMVPHLSLGARGGSPKHKKIGVSEAARRRKADQLTER